MDFISRDKSPNRHNDHDVDDRLVSQLRVRITFNYTYIIIIRLCPEIIRKKSPILTVINRPTHII